MIIEISVAIAVVIFAILAVFLIRVLVALRISLKRMDLAILETEIKLKSLDSAFRTISNIGDICENETAQLKNNYFSKREQPAVERTSDISADVADLVMVCVKLGQKFLKRR